MGLYNNVPTFTYVSASGITVTYNEKIYTVQSFYTNKKYIYWDSDNATVLQASNTMPTRSTKTHLVIINDNGIATTVPSTYDNFEISYDGTSDEAIKSRIYALYQKDKELGDKYIAIEQDVNGIKQFIGTSGEDLGTLIDKVSKVEQTSDEIQLSVSNIQKTYKDDKELSELRENLNSAIITLNSDIGTFNSEIQNYYKDDRISNEEKISIETIIDEISSSKSEVLKHVNTVILITAEAGDTTNLIALNSAVESLNIAHTNLIQNISVAISDYIVTPSEKTVIIDAFSKYSLRLTELKNLCDDLIFLGLGGVLVDELSKISVKTDEIKLSVSSVESNLKSDLSVQRVELGNQINDISNSLSNFKDTVNTTFRDGLISEAEKSLLQEKIANIDKEKLDIDTRYNSISTDTNLSVNVKSDLAKKYEAFNQKHTELKSRIEYVISDDMVNDAEKLDINALFDEYSSVLASLSVLMTEAMENISFNSSQKEIEQAKNVLRSEINDVKSSIEGIDEVLDGTFENNILDEVERENIRQNLDSLSREKLDIDKTYSELYNNAYLTGQDKVNLKNKYDDYISKYNNVVSISEGILAKEELVNNVDKANINNAVIKHNEAISVFHTYTNKSIDVIATNKVNSAKNEVTSNLNNLRNEVDGLEDTMNTTFKDGILSDAEKNSISQNLKTLETGKLNIDKQYNVVYNNASLTGTAKTELKTSYDNYVSKYNSLVTVINNILNKDGLLVESDSTNLNNAFKNHNNAMSTYNEKVNNAIDFISAKKVSDAKIELSNNISELNSALNGLENNMNNAFKDGVLSEAEKTSIKQHLLSVSSEKSDIDKRYAVLYSNTNLEGTPKTNLTTAYNNYVSAYNSLVTVINNILEKEGLIDSTDQTNLDNAFKEHDSKLGLYSTADLNAIDAIAKRKAEVESEKVDKKYAEIIVDLEEGITSRVEHINEQINGDGGISKRLQVAEEKITDEGITQIVQNSQFIKDMNGNIALNTDNISKIEQTADSINLKVTDLSGKYSEIKQTVDGIDLTGMVTFYDLSTSGRTTINGNNIKTGTIDASKVNIKGTSTKKIVVADDNYCVYDGTETDVNRKIFLGFRTNTAYNVPSVMLGYNGINPTVDGAVVSGGTYATYSHYPNSGNPENVNMSYSALAFKYNSDYSQFSTLNMYQNGEIDLKAGSAINFRPNLRSRGNASFIVSDTETTSKVPFVSTSSIKTASGTVYMYYGMLYFPQAGVWKNGTNISIGDCRLQGLTSLHLTNSTSSDSATLFCKNTNFSAVSSVGGSEVAKTREVSAIDDIMSLDIRDTEDGLRIFANTSLYSENSSNSKILNVMVDDEEGVVAQNVDVFTTISTLCKAVQELKQENEEIKKLISNTI